ncbi:MAG: TrmB family transcriptional regulator [Candidatus Bathyarchaeota archaeon B26-1]|nr:MAG: TrmB family transcriptional regulator [Candidatus Bathyarchaeota archaeon B26-1]
MANEFEDDPLNGAALLPRLKGKESVAFPYKKNGIWKPSLDRGKPTVMELMQESLSKFGLLKNETKVYLYLARFGGQKAQRVSEALSIHRTETYKILRKLEKMGLIYRVLDKPAKFVALPIDQALSNLIEIKRQRLMLLEKTKEEIVKLWRSLPRPTENSEAEKESFQILKGMLRINAKASEIIRKAKKEVFIVATDDKLFQMFHSGVLDELKKNSRRINVKLLTNYSLKSHFIVKKIQLNEKEFSYTELNIPSFILVDEEEILFFLEDHINNKKEFRAMWTNQKEIIKALRILRFFSVKNEKTAKRLKVSMNL